MPFIYSQVRNLQETKKVGSKQCVALVQHFVPGVGNTSVWKQGDAVLGNVDLAPGTAIATFVHGRYPNRNKGNHAAFFLEQGVNGFYVVDQWSDDKKKPLVSKRFIRTKGKKQRLDGWWPEGGNNAYAYSVIER